MPRLLVAFTCVLLFATAALADVASDLALLRGVTLRRGARGPTVMALQRVLTAAGAPTAADSVFGPRTEEAVRAFQAAHGCAVDGVVGGETVTALERVLGVSPPPRRTLRRLTNAEVTPAITAQAVAILRDHRAMPIGFEVPFTADGREYVGRLELHYNPPGGPRRPWGPHKGVSVFAVVD